MQGESSSFSIRSDSRSGKQTERKTKPKTKTETMIQKQVAHIVRRLIEGETIAPQDRKHIWQFLEQINTVPPMSDLAPAYDELKWAESGKPLADICSDWTHERLQLQAKQPNGPQGEAEAQKRQYQKIAMGAGDLERREQVEKPA
jgi:hypothetical protein